jgi:PilZ domain-containing protein
MEFETVQVLVRGVDGHRHPGRIDALWHSSDGVQMSIAFAAGRGPALPLGRAAQIGFSGAPFTAAADAAGLITSRIDGEAEDRYHLRFGEAAYPVLGVLFESRRAPRIPLSADDPVMVAVRSLGSGARPVACRLADISNGGVGIAVPLLQEGQLAGVERLRIGLILPGEPQPIVLDGAVRHRTLKGSEVHYGIEFDPSEREDDARYTRLTTWVEARVAQMRAEGKLPGMNAAAGEPKP